MKLYKILFLALIPMLFSCSDIFEKEIGNDRVVLITPLENNTYINYDQTFWWEKVDGTVNYNFQIVEGTFDRVLRLVMDSNVVSNKITCSLSPGDYQWRVKAINNNSETPYSTRSLSIDTGRIDNQLVNLISPLTQTFFKGKLKFSWNTLFEATAYVLEIDTGSGNFHPNEVIRKEVPQSSSTLIQTNISLPDTPGDFAWRVRAGKGKDSSKYSMVGYFTISDAIPLLKAPIEAFLVTANPPKVNLEWSAFPGASDYILIVRDSSAAIISTVKNLASSTNYLFDATGANKKFSWAVMGIDNMANLSDTSAYRTFTVK